MGQNHLDHCPTTPRLEHTPLAYPLPFFDGWHLIPYAESTTSLALVNAEGFVIPLTGTNDQIYWVAQHYLVLNKKTAGRYARFFLDHVGSGNNCFDVTEPGDSVRWNPEADDAIKDAFRAAVRPMEVRFDRASRLYIVDATVLFRSSLFRTDILVASTGVNVIDEEGSADELRRGDIRLCNERLVLEDLPLSQPVRLLKSMHH